MRIDLNHAPQATPETDRANPASNRVGSGSSANNVLGGEDQAQLSGAHAQVPALVAQVSQLPEVRQERVHALRQAIQSGHYRTNPDKVAGALFNHMIPASVS